MTSKRPSLWLAVLFLNILLPCLRADGPADNLSDQVRPVPPPGVPIPDEIRADLETQCAELSQALENARKEWKENPQLRDRLPDVEIFYKAVHDALAFNEIYDPKSELPAARALLQQGRDRLTQLRTGSAPWLAATGLVVRGYQSKLDDSIQPYGLVVPASYHPLSPVPYRLDFWFHGRGEKLTELSFLQGRLRSTGEFTPPNTIVLHLYGRYCNANKLAGEVDLFEAYENLKQTCPIDENRLVVRGFSMGGAACWQFAVHYAGRWAAAAPGAGFAETPDFLKVFQSEDLKPTWYEKKLWHLYDCTDYAVNLFQCPTVAYSGEIDKQRQAAEIMARAMTEEGLQLTHIIGPQTAHKYHPEARQEINRRIDAIAAVGRNPIPRHVRFTTWTLRYPEMLWVRVEGMKEHWERARVDAEIVDDHTIRVTTENVTHLALSMPPGLCPLDNTRPPIVILDKRKLVAPAVESDRSWNSLFRKEGARWTVLDPVSTGTEPSRKRPGLQGPIDDAFMDSFLMVTPSKLSLNESTTRWVNAELAHATNHWRSQFRGLARVKADTAVTDADIQQHNLILWGDPASNTLIARIKDQLPVSWDGQHLVVGTQSFASSNHVPVLIYPNPLNPRRYIVLNSGFTFREYDYLNNARQTPKLPDFAVLDIAQPRTSQRPGGIVMAGFFDEAWKLPSK